MNPPDSQAAEFQRLYERTCSRIYGYLRRRCPEPDCEDVIAEAYLTAWRHFAELPPDPVPWLIRAARNALSNHLRSMARRDRLALEASRLQQVAGPDSANQAVARADLLTALAKLSEADREVLLLAGWDELDSAGIGIAMGISPSTARARLSRARKRLGRVYNAMAERPQPTPLLITESN